MTTSTLHVAQLNIGRFRYETDDPRMADFMNNLERINAVAERSPGFVWRYTDATGNATDTRPFDGDPRMAVNLSVWESIEALEKFVWQTVHTRFYARKHEWFDKLDGAYFVRVARAAPAAGRACTRRSSGWNTSRRTGRANMHSAGRTWRPRSCGDRRAARERNQRRNGA